VPQDVEQQLRVLEAVLVERAVRFEDADEGRLAGPEAGERRLHRQGTHDQDALFVDLGLLDRGTEVRQGGLDRGPRTQAHRLGERPSARSCASASTIACFCLRPA